MNQSQESIRKFREMICSSDELQRKLTVLTRDFEEAHQPAQDAGEEELAALRRQAVEEVIIPAAREAGLDFSYEDMLAYEKSLIERDDDELSMEELQAVAGGEGTGVFICGLIGVGFGNTGNPNDNCFFIGAGIGVCFDSGVTV